MDGIESTEIIRPRICSYCEPLESILSKTEVVPPSGKSIISLGKSSRKPRCDLCRFLLSFSQNYKRKYQQHLRLFDHIRQPSIGPLNDVAVPRHQFLSVLRENPKLVYDYAIQKEATQQGLLTYIPRGLQCSSSDPIQFVDASSINFQLLNSWIEHCQQSHISCNRSESVTNYLIFTSSTVSMKR